MLIVEPSYQIQDELDQAAIVVRLEACGRICYKSEDLINKDSAMPFVRKIAEHGHNSVLEMAVVTLSVSCEASDKAALLALQPKYLIIDHIKSGLLVTGSVRAFRELSAFHLDNQLVSAMVGYLAGLHPYLFVGVYDPTAVRSTAGISVTKIRLDEVESFPETLLLRHRYVGVKFIVNRAVTHELVRHRPCSFLQESQRYCRYNQDKFGNQVTFIKPLFFAEETPQYDLWYRAMVETEQLYLQLLETSSPQAARTVLPNSCKTEIIVYCNLQQWRHIFSLRTIPAAEPSMREIMIPLAAELQRRYPAMASD